MSRRRYLSTEISTDTAVNRLATRSDFAALLYTWMIPHCGDDATIRGDVEKIMMMVMPGRRDKTVDDVVDAIALIEEAGLVSWDRDGHAVKFPPAAFYRHQSYIKDGERRGAHNTAQPRDSEDCAEDAAQQRKTPQNTASFKSSSSSSLTPPTVDPPSLRSPTGAETPKRPRSVKTPVPDDLASCIPPEIWRELGEEQRLTDDQLRFETGLMVDHFKARGERRPDWVASWRSWMRSEFRQSKPLPPRNGELTADQIAKLPYNHHLRVKHEGRLVV